MSRNPYSLAVAARILSVAHVKQNDTCGLQHVRLALRTDVGCSSDLALHGS